MSDENNEQNLEYAGRLARGSSIHAIPRSKASDPTQYKSLRTSARRRLDISKGKPQALLKVTSYGKGVQKVRRHLRYISRNSTLSLETENGDFLFSKKEINSALDEWNNTGFGSRKNSRDTVNIVLGVPPGEDREQLVKSVREFTRKAFADHRYLWVAHNDTDSPHVHVTVHMTNQVTGKKLNPRKNYLEEKRREFAAVARHYGIDIDASRAWERGRAPRNKTQQIEYRRMRSWNALSDEQKRAKRAAGYKPVLHKTERAVEAVKNERGQASIEAKPWEAARQRNVRARQAEFQEDAQILEQAANQPDRSDQRELQEAASRLREFASRMHVQQTRHQQLVQGIQQETQRQKREQERAPGADV